MVYVTSSKSEYGICRLLQRQVLHVVDLAKRVPGFQLMTHHDQFHLVKSQFLAVISSYC